MRLFYGLSLPDFVSRETARIARQSESLIAGRYSEVSNHHITLAFLGEVPPERLSDAERILQKHAAAFPTPTLASRKRRGFFYFFSGRGVAAERLHFSPKSCIIYP